MDEKRQRELALEKMNDMFGKIKFTEDPETGKVLMDGKSIEKAKPIDEKKLQSTVKEFREYVDQYYEGNRFELPYNTVNEFLKDIERAIGNEPS
jgi:phage gp36-like protein